MLLSYTGLELTRESDGNIDNSSAGNLNECNSRCVNTTSNNTTINTYI